MSLDKAIRFGKEHRDHRTPASNGCRPNGSCSYCRGNRLHRHRKRIAEGRDKLKEYLTK